MINPDYLHQKLFDVGPEIFAYILNSNYPEITPQTSILIDTCDGGWITTPSQRAVAALPEQRHIQGTLKQLMDPILKAIFFQEENAVDAVLMFTRGKEMPVIEEIGYHWQTNREKACRNCRGPGNPFDSCIVLRNAQNFPVACANCVFRKMHGTCDHSLQHVKEGRREAVESGVAARTSGAGTREDPIDLIGDDD